MTMDIMKTRGEAFFANISFLGVGGHIYLG